MNARSLLAGLLAAAVGLAAAALAAIDLQAPAMQAIRADYLQRKAAIEKKRADELKVLLDQHLKLAEAMLKEKKAAGNIPGMGAARQYTSICQGLARQLEEKKDFETPPQPRRELAAAVAAIAAEHKAIVDRQAAELARVDQDAQAAFAKTAAEQGGGALGADLAARLFRDLVKEAPAPSTNAPPAGGTNAVAGAAGGTNAPAAAPAAQGEPVVVGVSGQRVSEWVTIANCSFEVSDIEMVRVPVANRGETEETTNTSEITEATYKVRYEPVRLFTSASNCTFRVRSLTGDARAFQVTEWPRPGNAWILSGRARPPARGGPCEVELQVAFPGAERLPLKGGAAAPAATRTDAGATPAATGPMVRIDVRSTPPGALVYVDRRLYQTNDTPARTPCMVAMPAGKHTLHLRKTGFMDAAIPAFEAAEGRVVNWPLKANPAYKDTTLTLSPKLGWRASGVDVKAGDTIAIAAEGEWSCGSRKELVDADGYPNEARFFDYYVDPKNSPRQVEDAAYGRLLMRIGKDGAIVSVGKEYREKAATAGTLYFDINESLDSSKRRDNNGQINVRVQLIPPVRR